MDFDVRRRHLLTVPELREQLAFWREIAATSLNPNAVSLAASNARIIGGWLDYWAWQRAYRTACRTIFGQMKEAA